MELQTLRDAERYLDGLINREKKTQYDYERLGLAPIRALLAAIGNPERGLRCLHVAGSKGKGTVTLVAEHLLRAAGKSVGAYTSPHLVSWRERFRIDGAPVGEAALVRALRAMQPEIERLRQIKRLAQLAYSIRLKRGRVPAPARVSGLRAPVANGPASAEARSRAVDRKSVV